MGGVINIVSTAPRREAFLTAKVNTGSFGERDAAISTGLPLTRHRLTFSSSYAEGDGDFTFRNNNGTEQTDGDDYWDTRRNNWHRSFSAAAAFNGKFTPGTHVRLAGEYFQSDRGVPGLITFPSDHAEQEDRRAIASFRAAHTPAMADGVLTVALSGHLRRSTLNFRDPLGEQTGVPIDSSQTDTAVSVQSTADWRLSSSASADLTLCVDSETLSDRAFGEISRHGLAGILAFDLSLFRQRLHVHPVIRSEQISDAGSHTTGRLSARWDVPGGWQLTGSWGQSFRAPGFNELYLQTGVIEGNPELVSEHGTGGDVSVGYQRGSFHTRATAFRQNSRDLIQYVLISGFRFKPFNIGRARTTGIELELSSGISTWVTASVNYTISRCLDLTDDPNWHGKQIPGRPEHDLSARIAAEGVPLRPFVEYQWLSGNYLTRANTKWLDDRHLINAGLRLKLGSNWQAGAEVKNLGGQQAADVRGFPLPPRGFVLSITCSLGGERP